MSKHRSVVKHSYLTGKDKGMARAQAHVRYIQFRGGKDKDEEPRSFFNAVRDDIYSGEVKAAVKDQNERATVMHKLILSPGVPDSDVKEYCREVMADLSSRKGLDLEWYGVRHDNTDNPHVHIVVMGKDQNGHRVRLTKDDYEKIKESGDRYLERNRLLDREEKDKEKDKDERGKDERNGVTRFFDALKAAAREFSRVMDKDEKDKKPETKYEQRKREKEEERQQELNALGDPIDLDAYLAKQAEKEEKEEERKEKAWKAYCKPIEIDRGGNIPLVYDRSSSMESLRQLEKEYRSDDQHVRSGMTEADSKRLNDWIKEKYREEKRIEQKAEKLESIDIELDSENKGSWTKGSSLEDLRKLQDLNARGEVYLDDAECKALDGWMNGQEERQAIRIELEPGAEPVTYDREDSKESLQFLASEYAKGAQWARESLSDKDYRKVKSWIAEKDKPKEVEKEPEKDRIAVGKGEDGKERYASKSLDSEALRGAREQLAKDPGARKEDLKLLDSWIGEREKQESKTGGKEAHKPRRKQTAREKRMERSVRMDRAERWGNYYKEKSEQRQHLEGQRENLKGQKRALNKYEKERETVDGQYSEIWGADKAPLAAGSMGATSGGLRPLGANQLVKLLTKAKKNWEEKEKQARVEAAKTQKNLENKLTEDKKTEKPADKLPDKPMDKPKKETRSQEPGKDKEPAIDNEKLETETRELEKDITNKKKKEQDRDKRPGSDKEREDPFKYDPWGRY